MWKDIVSDLHKKAGFTFQAIANHTGLSRGAVHDLMTERQGEPGGEKALKLYDLHKREMAKLKRKGKAA